MDELETGRSISSNVTHSGDIDSMQNITFTAMRIAVVTCKVKPPSADMVEEIQNGLASGIKVASPIPSNYPNGQLLSLSQPQNNQQSIYKSHFGQPSDNLSLRLPANATPDDFAREVVQLCNFHGKSRQELISLLNQIPENLFCVHSNYASSIGIQQNNYSQPYSPTITSQLISQHPIFQSNISNEHSFSHSSSPMNTSPVGSTTTMFSQPNSIMNPLVSVGSMDGVNSMSNMDQSTTPPANTPETFMHYGQL